MKRSFITQEDYERFLGWLDTDREIAARKYEEIRLRLIRIFRARGCHEAEDLADETIDRVIIDLDQIVETYHGEPALYLYGVAQQVSLEFRGQKRKAQAHELIPTKRVEEETETPVIIQNPRPDKFFNASQQNRLTALMEKRKTETLSAAEETELENLVEAELNAARQRAQELLHELKS